MPAPWPVAMMSLAIDPPQGAAMPVHSLPMKSRKRLVRDVFGTFDTHAGLVMTSLIKTAGHKMAALTVRSSGLSNCRFLTTRTRNRVKKWFVRLFLCHSFCGVCSFRIPLISAYAVPNHESSNGGTTPTKTLLQKCG